MYLYLPTVSLTQSWSKKLRSVHFFAFYLRNDLMAHISGSL